MLFLTRMFIHLKVKVHVCVRVPQKSWQTDLQQLYWIHIKQKPFKGLVDWKYIVPYARRMDDEYFMLDLIRATFFCV